ncbi:hypothetical protein D3C73_1264680 [compost metagenome]
MEPVIGAVFTLVPFLYMLKAISSESVFKYRQLKNTPLSTRTAVSPRFKYSAWRAAVLSGDSANAGAGETIGEVTITIDKKKVNKDFLAENAFVPIHSSLLFN